MRFDLYTKKEKRSICGIILFALLIGVFIGWFAGKSQIVSAKSTEDIGKRNKYYTSISIQAGDTLWSIAEEYQTEEYATLKEYVREIKYCNNLFSDRITEGKYLLIPYYAEEQKKNDSF